MRFDTVLIDIDDTLFDFRKSSYQALVKAFSEIGFSFGEQEMREYEVFNNQMWKSFELGEIERNSSTPSASRRYFASIGLNADRWKSTGGIFLSLPRGATSCRTAGSFCRRCTENIWLLS